MDAKSSWAVVSLVTPRILEHGTYGDQNDHDEPGKHRPGPAVPRIVAPCLSASSATKNDVASGLTLPSLSFGSDTRLAINLPGVQPLLCSSTPDWSLTVTEGMVV